MYRTLRCLLRRAGPAIIGVVGMMLGGCVPVGVGATIEVAPPAPHVEVVPGAPGPGYVWVDGYWNWTGVHYVWVPGAWVWPSSALSIWVPPTYIRVGDGYRFVPGYWSRHRHHTYRYREHRGHGVHWNHRARPRHRVRAPRVHRR